MSTTYWLSRNGAAAEGPFAESQLLQMWRNGQFAATDQLCMTDTEDWMAASIVIHDIEAAANRQSQEARRREAWTHAQQFQSATPKSTAKKGRSKRIVRICVVVFCLLAWIGLARQCNSPEGRALSAAINTKVALESWARHSFADKDAEVISIGNSLPWESGVLRILSVRGKNAFGGPVVNEYVVSLNENQSSVISGWRPKEWLEIYGKKPEAARFPGTLREIETSAILQGH